MRAIISSPGEGDLISASLGNNVMVTPSNLTNGANVFNYASVFFVPSSSGSYTFGQTEAGTDTVMILYTGIFNPTTPGTGALVGNDDTAQATHRNTLNNQALNTLCGNLNRCPQITSTVTSGQTYSLVTSTYSPDDSLTTPPGSPLNMSFYSTGAGAFLSSPPTSSQYVPASNFRTLGAAEILDALNGGSGEMANLLTALSAMTPAQQAAVLERLAPVTSRAVQLSLRNNLLMSFDRLSARMDAMRYAPSSGGGSGDGDLANGLWFKPFGGGLRQDATAGFAGYDGSNWGLSGGYDYSFNTATTAGLAFAYTNTNIGYNDQQSGDSNKIDSYEISAYGTHNLGVAYLEAMASWSRQTYASQRNTFLNGIANGSFDGDLWGARIGAGLPLAVYTATTLTPIVRLDWNHISQNAYTETDAGALNLDVAAASTNRLRSSLGAQLNHDAKLLGFAVQPFFRAFWHYDFMNSGVSASSSFAGGGAAFLTPGQELDRYTGTVGAGMNVFTHNNFTGSVAYDYNVGSAYQSHTAQAQIRWSF
jgi:outer membrane autotransporter protein